ncbi:MAG: lipoprotein insertase outer membrane protein LolB [Candidatus Marinimicrobia bacterium]|nr:lipoprotein insertase outer membrane protein LolB [Candidatus Neomarinimicrobiota bacterium]
MKVFKKNYLTKHRLFPVICLSLGLILHGCSAIQNISRKSEPAVSPRPASIPPLSQSIETLTFNARIAIQSPDGDIALSAQLVYTGMDTVTIRIKDPLKRQLATLTITRNDYNLWLQRENRYLSGSELPTHIGDYSVPQLPLKDIAEILIGQLDSKNISFKTTFDRLRRLSRISLKTNPDLIVTYKDWNPIETYYWIPTSVVFTNNRDIKITIHYSQFQIELRKLT